MTGAAKSFASAHSRQARHGLATGETPEETKARMGEAMEMHLAGLREERLPVPAPSAIGETVEVGAKAPPWRQLRALSER